MDFTKLENNIIDVVQEEQLKLGYRREQISLFYPLSSLNHFLETSYRAEEMLNLLRGHFCGGAGKIKTEDVTCKNERFCLIVAEKTVSDIHDMPKDSFLAAFIEKIRTHNCTIDDLLEVFRKYSENVHCERVRNGEFNYLIYFENGTPNSYRYCITDEGCHMAYHRFTEEDYLDFGF